MNSRIRRLARLVRATFGAAGRVRRTPPPGIDAAPSLLPSPGGAVLARAYIKGYPSDIRMVM
ncbi:hypothetical protein NUBL21974_07250 [Klebsiella quasipneumoniae]|nr:hypothetical protein NUBL21974_07250 [Klebsiella quasipneumoniae]